MIKSRLSHQKQKAVSQNEIYSHIKAANKAVQSQRSWLDTSKLTESVIKRSELIHFDENSLTMKKIFSIAVITIEVNCYLHPCIISIITIVPVIALFLFIA